MKALILGRFAMAQEQHRVNTTSSVELELPSPACRILSFHKDAARLALSISRQAVFLLLFTSLLSALFVGCSVAATSNATGYSFSTLDRGSQSGVRERKLVVIKNENDWKALWTSHTSLSVPLKAMPPADFQTEMIVAVFSGEKPTGGYSIEITGIREDSTKHALEVVVHESNPSRDAMVTQVLTQPYHIVKLRQIQLPVTFVFR